ncbi:hypothetical protein BT69DRAFT_1263031 [Atractiella rhizophila]|nr:hypothetical protein BT69DRAFT_1263031 [Atractiella rhizophila]
MSSSSPHKLSPQEAQKVSTFVNQSPNDDYTFDSERNSNITELCAKKNGQLSCIKVAAQSTALFAYMQHLGYFCQLPFDPTETHIQCRRIEKITGLDPKRA